MSLEHIELTPRQADIAPLLVQGCSNSEIAAALRISEWTVKHHLHALFLRFGISRGQNKRVRLATALFKAT